MNRSFRILIVDDNLPVLLMLEKILTTEGFLVSTASCGDEAVRIARVQQFDLFIIDLIMPTRDGIETILALRARDKKTPIIAMSGGWDGGSKSCLPLAEKIGACGTLAKPFDRSTLLSAVDRELRGGDPCASRRAPAAAT